MILRKDTDDDKIFVQVSYYYTCDVDTEMRSLPKLDDGYETEYDYNLIYVSLDNAIETNEKLLNTQDIPYVVRRWAERDLTVMYDIKSNSE